MQRLFSLGAIGYAALGLVVSYFNTTTNTNSDESRLVIDWECRHEWSTCLEDKSLVDDFDCYVTEDDGSFPAEVFWCCERCQLRTNLQTVKVHADIISHGNKAMVGKLSFNAFKNKLISSMDTA